MLWEQAKPSLIQLLGGGQRAGTGLPRLSLGSWSGMAFPNWTLPCFLMQRSSEHRLSAAELCANASHALGFATALNGISICNLSLQLFAVSGEEEKVLWGINFKYKDNMLHDLAGGWPGPAVPGVQCQQ